MVRGAARAARFLLVPAALLCAAVAGSTPSAVPAAQAASGTTKTVVLKNVAFTPATLRIHRGDRVTWDWQDPYVSHNLHAIGKPRFTGASARQKGTYTVRFTKAGTYRYECTLHPGMTGRVIVR